MSSEIQVGSIVKWNPFAPERDDIYRRPHVFKGEQAISEIGRSETKYHVSGRAYFRYELLVKGIDYDLEESEA